MTTISAPRDANRVPVWMGTASSDGQAPALIYCNASLHALKVSDSTTGASLTSVDIQRDANRQPVFWATSSVDGKTPVPVYTDASNNLLIDSK